MRYEWHNLESLKNHAGIWGRFQLCSKIRYLDGSTWKKHLSDLADGAMPVAQSPEGFTNTTKRQRDCSRNSYLWLHFSLAQVAGCHVSYWLNTSTHLQSMSAIDQHCPSLTATTVDSTLLWRRGEDVLYLSRNRNKLGFEQVCYFLRWMAGEWESTSRRYLFSLLKLSVEWPPKRCEEGNSHWPRGHLSVFNGWCNVQIEPEDLAGLESPTI